MSGEIAKFLKEQKLLIIQEKKRLGFSQSEDISKINVGNLKHEENCDNDVTWNNKCEQSLEENKENVQLNSNCVLVQNDNKTLPLVEPLDITSKSDSNDVSVEDRKQAFINKLVSSEIPLTDRSNDCVKSAMLRFGEYSPNNPQVRVTAAPYLGLGEYEQRRNYFLQKQRADYLTHLAKQQDSLKELSTKINSNHDRDRNKPTVKRLNSHPSTVDKFEKSVQTDIQNIKTQLLQYDLQGQRIQEKELSPCALSEDYYMKNNRNLAPFRVDQRLTSAQNALLKSEMDKPKSILSNRKTGSPRERLMSDLYSSSFTDGFGYRESRADELERERMKRDAYQRELRLQIEEKRMMQQMREEQERRERDLENKRLEQQLLRMQEERLVEDQLSVHRQEQMRRHSEDMLRRKQELQSTRYSFRKHANSECSIRNNPTDISSKSLSHYSPPVSRRNPYSFNIPSTSVFPESSSRLQRRSSSGRFEDPLPVPVLKAHSPVAKELKNSIPYSSRQSSDAIRRLEDRWQIPAVQKNVMNHTDSTLGGQNRSILTQLGAIRMQLQQEQLRMDESLRRRDITQSKAVDFL
ncbi:unnamed protein product [Psylliodes chrysocephalus]|uniref:Uncharacterized protein n=1 Tax=Psylliodes chrysocephalus TaxID=3402493 RepID=A0A9P0DA80_9CUCU|nr:unnamed protein product [Psylliodes chrysocephala]